MAGDPTDLCALADVKSWLNISTTASDATLARLITAASRVVSSFLRPPPLGGLLAMAYNEKRNGTGQYALSILNTPAFAVSSLVIDTAIVQVAPDPLSSGYAFDAETIYLDGVPSPSGGSYRAFGFGPLRFTRGNLNVAIGYSAGYALPNQIPTDWPGPGGPLSQNTLFGQVIQPLSGNAGNFIFVCIRAGRTGNTAPVWAQAQTGSTVIADGTTSWINLGVSVMPTPIPPDITQAVIELASLRSSERTRVGQVSQHIDGQTVSYWMRSSMTPSIQEALQPYRDVRPVLN